eukprot:SM000207S06174  [mRNA]  locus=s207:134225:135372:+ [translate_table: standard]
METALLVPLDKGLHRTAGVGLLAAGVPSAQPTGGLAELLTCLALAAAMSAALAIGQFFVEYAGFHGLCWLERRSLVRRFAPSVPFKVMGPRWQNFCSVAGSHFPLLLGAAACRRGLLARAAPDFNPASIWPFVWATMVAHDAWFFALHTLMHRYKAAYAALHQRHHEATADLNAWGTAYAEEVEFLLDWSAFYAAVLALQYARPSWNPVSLLATLAPVAAVNVMGHSGYDLPVWLWVPLSAGVLLTPGAQESADHFIHHVDPRFNRSLYFTWWDHLAGTYRATHRLIPTRRQAFLRKPVQPWCASN